MYMHNFLISQIASQATCQNVAFIVKYATISTSYMYTKLGNTILFYQWQMDVFVKAHAVFASQWWHF